MSPVFPAPFEAKAPDGSVVVVDDVDVLIGLAAKYANVPLRKLDRRKLEAALATIAPPPMHAERAVMVFVGRKRQAHLASIRRGVRRLQRFAIAFVAIVATAIYGYRLHRRLDAKLDRARVAEVVYLRERSVAIDALRRLESAGLDAGERSMREAVLDAAEDRAASARRRYDALANDYVTAVRGFPTAPFARAVGLPPRVPMSWELPRDR